MSCSTLCVNTVVYIVLCGPSKPQLTYLEVTPLAHISLSWLHLSVWVDGWCVSNTDSVVRVFFGKLISQYYRVLVYTQDSHLW